ncbi:MAG: sugar isomerase domain-containing protein [Spirochaetaceae bacterium]
MNISSPAQNHEQSPALEYTAACRRVLDRVEEQTEAIRAAAEIFSRTILHGRSVHVFASGHSRILVDELWPRYGSFPGFNPIVELSLTFHNLVVGANGQRQAMFIENVSGLAARILRNFGVESLDSALVMSSGGTTVVATEMAEILQEKGIPVVAIVSAEHSKAAASKRDDGRKLPDFADIVLDSGAPAGDAAIRIPGLETPVAPLSTVGGCTLINAVKAELARILTEAGAPPPVLTGPMVVGAERSAELFELAYDEHAHRMAKVYEGAGRTQYAAGAAGEGAVPRRGGDAAAGEP